MILDDLPLLLLALKSRWVGSHSIDESKAISIVFFVSLVPIEIAFWSLLLKIVWDISEIPFMMSAIKLSFPLVVSVLVSEFSSSEILMLPTHPLSLFTLQCSSLVISQFSNTLFG